MSMKVCQKDTPSPGLWKDRPVKVKKLLKKDRIDFFKIVYPNMSLSLIL